MRPTVIPYPGVSPPAMAHDVDPEVVAVAADREGAAGEFPDVVEGVPVRVESVRSEGYPLHQ